MGYHAWKIWSEDLKISDRLANISVNGYGVQDFSANHRKKIREKSWGDKAHYLFHAVVGWMSGSGANSRGQVEVGAGGRRMEVGRFDGGSVGSGGGRVVRRQSGGQAGGGHDRLVLGPTAVPHCIGFGRSWPGR